MTTRRTLITAAAALPFAAYAQKPDAARPPRPPYTKRVLIVGVDPDLVDYSQLPGLNAETLRAILEGQKSILEALGCDVEWCFIDTGPTAQREVVTSLLAAQFNVVSIGAGVRLPPENMLLFERVINAVHHHAPEAKICFSVTANDTAAAVQRWLQ